MNNNLFSRRKIAIATMHSKEQVIAPLLKKYLNVHCSTPEINTDIFGTFSGETERLYSPIESARKKCEFALKTTGFDLAIASEGSFGKHPYIPFAAADNEIVLLLDKKNNLEIFGQILTTETNFRSSYIYSLEEAMIFAEKTRFPEHSLIIRTEPEEVKYLVKGINEMFQFKGLIQQMLKKNGSVWVETDMRAMHNPTRMNVIKQATLNLIDKLKSTCPSCFTPGFWMSKALPGLPCSHCNMPTKSTSVHVYNCLKCDYSEKKKHPHSKKAEDPAYCDFCNP